MAKKGLFFKKKKRRRDASMRPEEEEALGEYEQDYQPRVKVPKWLWRVLIIVAVCTLGVVIWLNRANLAPDRVMEWVQDELLGMGTGPGYPAALVGSTVETGNFQLLEDDVAVLSDTSFVTMNRTAKELCNRQHSFGQPVLRVNGDKALIYNLGGKGYQLETRSKTLGQGTMDANIFVGAVSPSGIYALVTETKGFFGKLTVYLQDGTERYTYSFADAYITAVALNREGNLCAAAGFTAEGGAMKSVVYLISFDSEEPVAKLVYEDCMFLAAEFLENGNLALVGDKLASVVDCSSFSSVDYSYLQQGILAYEIKPNAGVAVALASSDDGKASKIVLLGMDGQTQKEWTLPRKVISVARTENTVALLSGGTIYGFDTDGTATGTWEVGEDVRKLLLYGDKDAYLLGITEIRSIGLQ